MLSRATRQNRFDDDESVDDYKDGAISSTWQPRPIADLKITELYKKDLISAMRLLDSTKLNVNEYVTVTDKWKAEWERGVQVPVNPDSVSEPSVTVEVQESLYAVRQDFNLPKSKFIRITKDENFSSELHHLSKTEAMAEAVCAYDLDEFDDTWLKIIDGERALVGAPSITEDQFERVIEKLEILCWKTIQGIVRSEELGIEYDEKSDEEDSKRNKQCRDMSTEEKIIVRKNRVKRIEAEFEKHVNVRDINCHLMGVDQEAIHLIYNYWILKRKSLRNQSLIPLEWDDGDVKQVEQEHEAANMHMRSALRLRFDLERARDLSYLVKRREQLKRSYIKLSEETFNEQISVLSEIKSKRLSRDNNVQSVYEQT